jgi:hypothetical protein
MCVMERYHLMGHNVNRAHIKHIGQHMSIDIPGNFFICS